MPQDYSDYLAYWFHTVTNVLGLFFNSLLTYLIITHTPKPLKPYGVLLINVSISDLLACIFAYMSMTRIITAGESVCFFYHGPCIYVSGPFCFYCYAFMLHWFAHNLFILFISFIYRYYILKYSAPSRTLLWTICIIIYLPSFSQFSSFCFSIGPEEIARANLQKYHPTYDLDAYVLTGNVKLIEPLTLYTTLYMCGPVAPMYVLMLICRRKVYTALNTVQAHLSENTKKTHRALMKALTIQACLPSFFLCAVLSFCSCAFGIYQSPFMENLVFSVLGVIPMLSPLMTLWFVKPYRTAVIAIFRLEKLSALLRPRVGEKAPSVSYFVDTQNNTSEAIPA